MKSKAVLAVFSFAAALALSLPAKAQTSTGAFYAGGTLGSSTNSEFCNQLGPTCIDQRGTWRILGGYQFNRYFAVEAGFHNLGVSRDDDPAAPRSARATAAEFVGILSIPVGRDFAVYGKAGAYRGKLNGSVTGVTFKESNTDVTYGLGLQWNYFEPVSLRAELQRYPRMGGRTAGPETNIYVWSLGAIFKFK